MVRPGEVLERLEAVILSRRAELLTSSAGTRTETSDRSYTSRLLAGGVGKIGGKVTEEAGELVAAAAGETDERVVAETADLLYHTLVLLAARDLRLSAVEAELARRFGVSGLDEKAARPPKPSTTNEPS